MSEIKKNDNASAWNPGVESEIPAEFRQLETIYSEENVFTSLDEVNQLVAETGLNALELICFRPHRLALHELIVRVTADIVVLEGEAEEDLGINFRAITRQIFNQYIQPDLEIIEQDYDQTCTRLREALLTEIAQVIATLKPAAAPVPTFWQRLTGQKPKPVVSKLSREEREFDLINQYKSRSMECEDEVQCTVLRTLYRVLSSLVRTRGFIGNDRDYLLHVCERHTCNYLSSRLTGLLIAKHVDQAVITEGYERIPDAQKPVLFSLKGASASGKSHLRPMLRSKMATLGIKDRDYGTISPDIWRKLLLDYQSLGESYKYAGRFTSHEVSMIDTKLDRYIRDKAEKSQSIPHLVVDRFRFDSFASEKIGRVLHRTYVRYIDTMYMYFIITPPEATVERGWQRGLERGRYKAVEDYLGHCVEAYEGMPKLLFKWLANDRPRYSFKFMDNSVPKGSPPRMIARGSQGWMQIFDLERFIDIERFKRININARHAEEVASTAEVLTVTNNLGFLRQCIKRIENIEFSDRETEQPYLLIQNGVYEVVNEQMFQSRLSNTILGEILEVLAPELLK